jgi:hypothetical protein
MDETLTPEEIQRHYDAAMDSVSLLNSGKPESLTEEEWGSAVYRNIEHLKIMVAKDYWTNQDLSPFYQAISGAG